ncbi:MAG: hypothetical protein R2855_13620 [Thermomicrobiales bacterium]
MRRVVDAVRVRKALGMTQVQFSSRPSRDLRWARSGIGSRSAPSFRSHQAAASYLRVIEQNPEAVIAALAAYRTRGKDEAEEAAQGGCRDTVDRLFACRGGSCMLTT